MQYTGSDIAVKSAPDLREIKVRLCSDRDLAIFAKAAAAILKKLEWQR
jgi:hypothetical protein